MKKFLAFLLAGFLLAAVPPAGAEYKKYQVTEGNWWQCFPLDAHNAVVSCRLWEEDGEPDPWYVCWYRDGSLYRQLEGTVPEDGRAARMGIPYPARWDGERLSLYYCVRKGEMKTVLQGNRLDSHDPDSFDVYMAEWTEDGLSTGRVLPEAWFDFFDRDDRGILVFGGENGRTALYRGRETVLPDSIPVNREENILRVLPAGGEAFLVKTMDNKNGRCQAVCVDHGTERYRVTLPEDEALSGRILLPDSRGGFFCLDGFLPEGYEPERLAHYLEDGRYDRTVTLSGDRVVVRARESVPGPEGSLCTVYGTAVANSRKVYAVFAMTLDGGLNVTNLDVRKIDPAYGNYAPDVLIAADGTPYVFIENYSKKPLWPVLIPFSELKKSGSTYGLKLLK